MVCVVDKELFVCEEDGGFNFPSHTCLCCVLDHYSASRLVCLVRARVELRFKVKHRETLPPFSRLIWSEGPDWSMARINSQDRLNNNVTVWEKRDSQATSVYLQCQFVLIFSRSAFACCIFYRVAPLKHSTWHFFIVFDNKLN